MPSVWVPKETARHAQDYGLRCDGTTDDCAALSQLCNTRMQPAGGDVYLSGVTAIGATLNVPSNVTLHFAPGAMLKPANGVTMTLAGLLEARPTQPLFANIGPGQGTVTITRPQPLTANQFGAKADGRMLTDATTTSGSTSLHSASYTFTTAVDVGKSVSVIEGTQNALTAVSATAGNRTFSITHAGSPIPQLLSTGHRVLLTGAGPGGADLLTTITDTDTPGGATDVFHIQDPIGTTVSGGTGFYYTNTNTTITAVAGGNATLGTAPNRTRTGVTVYFGSDDTAAVNTAVAAAAQAGAPLHFPAGCYVLNNVQLVSGSRLYFEPGASVQSAPNNDLLPVFFGDGAVGARLSDIALHGHKTPIDAAQNAYGCLRFEYCDGVDVSGFDMTGSVRATSVHYFYSTDGRFERCSTLGGSYGFISENCTDVQFSRCTATNGGLTGFLLYHLSQNVSCDDCLAVNGGAWYQTGSGAGFEGYTSLDVRFRGCKARGTTNTASAGIRFRDVVGGSAIGCHVSDTANVGISVQNKAKGATGNNYFTDFYTGGRITIQGCVIHDTAQIGIDVATTEEQRGGCIQGNTLYNIGYIGGVATNQATGIRCEHPGWIIANNDLADIGGPGIQTLDSGFPNVGRSPDRLVISGNHINGASRASANAQGGILLASSSRNVLLTGNLIEDELSFSGTPTTGYGIRVTSSGNQTATAIFGTNQILWPIGGNAISMLNAKAIPQVLLGGGAIGTGATVTIVAPSNDQWGQISFASGTGAQAAGTVATIYPRGEMTHTPRVQITPVLTGTDALQGYVTASGPGITLAGGSTFTTTGTALTATGSLFSIELNVGDLITIAAQVRRVVAIASDTALTLSSALSSDVSGQTATAPNKSKWDLKVGVAPTASTSSIWYYRVD